MNEEEIKHIKLLIGQLYWESYDEKEYKRLLKKLKALLEKTEIV